MRNDNRVNHGESESIARTGPAGVSTEESLENMLFILIGNSGSRIGDPENGVAPGTAWEDVPEDWVCPTCGLGKDAFFPAA